MLSRLGKILISHLNDNIVVLIDMQKKLERHRRRKYDGHPSISYLKYVPIARDFIYLAGEHTMKKEGMQFRFNRCILIELIWWLEKVQG